LEGAALEAEKKKAATLKTIDMEERRGFPQSSFSDVGQKVHQKDRVLGKEKENV
jgi:hypothetical protein